MTLLFRIRAIFTITLKRLWAQKGLTTVLVLGITAAVALIMTVPLYADAVYFRILQERIVSDNNQWRPPFAYLYDYIGTWHGPVQLEDVLPLDEYLRGSGRRALGLPQERLVHYLESERYRLYPADTADYGDQTRALGVFQFGTATDFAGNIDLLEGALPRFDPSAGAPIEVLVAEKTANELGFQTGDQLIAYNYRDPDSPASQLPVRISGVWRPVDDGSSYWFIPPTSLDDALIVDEQAFANSLAPLVSDEVNRAIWYLVMDGSQVSTPDVDRLISGANQVERRVDTLLPNTSQIISPVDALVSYRSSAQRLQLLLAAFNVPVIALVLAFVILIVGLAVDQRRNEFAVMRSRGATPWQVVGLSAVEGLLLGLLSFALGTLLALALTQLMGRTRSFLDFSATHQLRMSLNEPALRAGLLAIGLAIIAQVLPALAASRDTIITYKQDQARSLKKPIWQRLWLDVLLLALTLYGFYLLQQQGSLFAVGEAAREDLFQNPLLLLLPSLAVFSLTLLFMRLFPWLMAALSWLLAQSDSVGLLLASRELARTPRAYAMPLILLVLTVSLAVFIASLAYTLDLQLIDDARYATGADVNLRGPGISFGVTSQAPGGAEQPSRAIFLPLAEYEAFPGVSAATRVGRFSTTVQVGGQRSNGTYLGIDPGGFSRVAFWRHDFADDQINGLLNQLSLAQDGLLVSRDFLRGSGLRSGDYVRLTVHVGEGDVDLEAPIVGVIDYFPTWYEAEDGPLFVGNLDALFTQSGGDKPYQVWLKTAGGVDGEALDSALRERNLFGWNWREPFSLIQQEQLRPERQGLFGQLSVGFIAAALLTVIGFFMYALFSFRRRFVSLGILRAVGLSARQMSVLVGWETAVLIFTGLSLGTLLGIWISKLFIPYLQVGREAADLIPPYLVEIAWPAIYQIYGLFLLLFLAAMILLVVLLRRMKIFQAIKLGETV